MANTCAVAADTPGDKMQTGQATPPNEAANKRRPMHSGKWNELTGVGRRRGAASLAVPCVFGGCLRTTIGLAAWGGDRGKWSSRLF